MDITLDYYSPTGSGIRLISPRGEKRSAVTVERDSIEGFVASFEDHPVAVPGQPGAFVDVRDRTINPMPGSFTAVVLQPDKWGSLRSLFSTTSHGRLELAFDRGGVQQVFYTPVRLAQTLPALTRRLQKGSRVTFNMVSDAGIWLKEDVQSGRTFSATAGPDLPTWFTVEAPAGTTVTLPSAATVAMPTARMSFAPPQITPGDPAAPISEHIQAGNTGAVSLSAPGIVTFLKGALDPWP